MDEEIQTTYLKVSGYLEKKGKMRLSSWKKYWFVLEGRLLLYYRSKDEYRTISPCKGSINMGPPCCVKSCPSVSFGFQIQTRVNTVTLRAENVTDQKMWMQAIMLALKQNQQLTVNDNLNPSTRLSHFRYSLDNLVPSYEQDVVESRENKPRLERQSSMPLSFIQNPKQYSNLLVERLQKMGAQTYGCGVGVGTLLKPHNKESTRNQIDDPTITPSGSCPGPDDKFNEHLDTNNSRLKSMTIDNDQYGVTSCNQKEHIVALRRNQPVYENLSKPSNDKEQKGMRRVTSYMEDNQNYSISMKMKSSKSQTNIISKSNNNNNNSILIQNDCYNALLASPRRGYSDVIYAEPHQNAFEHTYCEIGDITRNNHNHTNNNNNYSENQYEELLLNNDNKKPNLMTNTNENNESELMQQQQKKSKNNKKKGTESPPPQQQSSVKKSGSFLRKMWKRKGKKISIGDNNNDDHSALTPSPPIIVADKMLIPQTINSNKQQELGDENTVLMLSELNNLLINKRSRLAHQMTNDSSISNPTDRLQCSDEREPLLASHDTEEQPPQIPPKHKNHDLAITIINKNNNQKLKTIDEILDDLNKDESISKSDVDKSNNNQEVDEKDVDEDEVVVLRNYTNNNINNTNNRKVGTEFGIQHRPHSDELNKLLDELTRVTSAPILTPGATFSLIDPSLIVDEEWSKVLPAVRQRRTSEPDYDIPRPHKSIQSLPRKEQSNDIIRGTRFFGPILSTDEDDLRINLIDDEASTKEEQDATTFINSISPDSLEPFYELTSTTIEDHPSVSYTSHSNYYVHHQCMERNREATTKLLPSADGKYIDNYLDVIYAKPKPLLQHTQTITTNWNGNDQKIIAEKNLIIIQETFHDSLEVCAAATAETSTVF